MCRTSSKRLKSLAVSGALAFAVIALSVPREAAAISQLSLSDGTTTIVITDGGPGDTIGATGVVGADTTIGTFTVNLAVGTTKPALGSATDPQMHITQFLLTSSTGGTFTVMFTDTDYSLSSAGIFATSMGGAGDGQRTFSTYFDAGNTAFAQTTLLGTIGPLGGAVGGSTFSAPVGPDAAFSLTAVAVVTHTGAGATSLDASLRVPEPASMLLLGSSLVGLGLWRRMRKQA